MGLNVEARRSRTAHEYAREVLRSAILDGSIEQGSRLVQGDIAEQLGLSITPVREALRDLASERLVVIDPHRGSLVNALDLEEVREIYELRMALEPLMVRRAIAQMREEQLDRAERLHHEMGTVDDTAAWAQLNRDFHAHLYPPDDRSRLRGILDSLRDSATSFVRLSLHALPDRVVEAHLEHAQLLDAFRRRDSETAVSVTLQHLQSTLDAIEESRVPGATGSP